MNLNDKVKSQLDEEERGGVRLKAQVTQLETKIESLTRELLSFNSSQAPSSGFDGIVAALQRIIDEALNDINNSSFEDITTSELLTQRRSESRSPPRSSSRSASFSPVRGGRELSSIVESAFGTVNKALRGRRMQVGELKSKVSVMQDQTASLKRQTEELESEKRRLESSLSGLKEERSQL